MDALTRTDQRSRDQKVFELSFPYSQELLSTLFPTLYLARYDIARVTPTV